MEDRTDISPETWKAYLHGDKCAYAAIYKAYYTRCYNYGRRFTTDVLKIEDAIQEIFTQFWFNRGKMHSVNDLPGYLLISFRNQLLKTLREDKKTTYEDEAAGFDLQLSIEQVMINADHLYEQRFTLERAISNLTTRQKEAIFLRFYENLSYDQIASVFGITTKATYKLVARAVTELREAYKAKLSSSLFSILFYIVSCFA